MKLSEAATYMKCAPNVLINEMKKRFPGKGWKLDSELPDEFVKDMQRYAEEYQAVLGEEGAVPVGGEIEKTKDAIANSKTTTDAIEYGILEALSSQKVAVAQLHGTAAALRGIQSYENANIQTWELYFGQKSQILDSQIQKLENQISENAIGLAADLGKRQETLAKMTADSQTRLEQWRARSQALVNAAIGSSTN